MLVTVQSYINLLYYLSTIGILKLVDMVINLLFLILGFIFTFFIPGFLIIETFFSEIPIIQKIPLHLLISVLVSTYAVYIISLVFGFSRSSILLTFLLFELWLIIFLINKRFKRNKTILDTIEHGLGSLKSHVAALFSSMVIFALFLIALYPAIFSFYKNYFVMSAVNWQDTAMHQSIIQTISQGNFPPQAPYFSGQPLNYYYFIDFHTAILQTLYSNFFPRILVYDNPIFVLIFFLSVYALGYQIFRSRLAAIIAGWLVVFCGSFLYFNFFQDIYRSLSHSNFSLEILKDIIANHGYTLDYGKLMQMTPVADYFLQNRPMMVGLPAVALVTLMLIEGFDKLKVRYLILAGILVGMLVKFQLFAFGVSLIIFILFWLIFPGLNLKKRLKQLVFFLIPCALFLFMNWLLFASSSYALDTFLSNFRLGIWDKTRDLYWYLEFPFANFGIPFLFFLSSLPLIFLRKNLLTKKTIFLLILGMVLFIIPYLVFFTIYDGDMLKFFYFALIPFSLVSGFLLQKIWQRSRFGPLLVIILILISSFNGLLTLGWSFFNKNQGYAMADYQVGGWIRSNTLPNSVFLTMPTVHCAVSDIGGRVRILSYTTWPYSHGFNKGIDNVFTRQYNIESIYKNPADIENAKKILNLYHANYIYLGDEEKAKFPSAKQSFDRQSYLQLVYDLSGIQIYKIL